MLFTIFTKLTNQRDEEKSLFGWLFFAKFSDYNDW